MPGGLASLNMQLKMVPPVIFTTAFSLCSTTTGTLLRPPHNLECRQFIPKRPFPLNSTNLVILLYVKEKRKLNIEPKF